MTTKRAISLVLVPYRTSPYHELARYRFADVEDGRRFARELALRGMPHKHTIERAWTFEDALEDMRETMGETPKPEDDA